MLRRVIARLDHRGLRGTPVWCRSPAAWVRPPPLSGCHVAEAQGFPPRSGPRSSARGRHMPTPGGSAPTLRAPPRGGWRRRDPRGLRHGTPAAPPGHADRAEHRGAVRAPPRVRAGRPARATGAHARHPGPRSPGGPRPGPPPCSARELDAGRRGGLANGPLRCPVPRTRVPASTAARSRRSSKPEETLPTQPPSAATPQLVESPAPVLEHVDRDGLAPEQAGGTCACRGSAGAWAGRG